MSIVSTSLSLASLSASPGLGDRCRGRGFGLLCGLGGRVGRGAGVLLLGVRAELVMSFGMGVEVVEGAGEGEGRVWEAWWWKWR